MFSVLSVLPAHILHTTTVYSSDTTILPLMRLVTNKHKLALSILIMHTLSGTHTISEDDAERESPPCVETSIRCIDLPCVYIQQN